MSVLQEILAHKVGEVEASRTRTPLAELRAQLTDLPPTRGFRAALAHSPHPVALIAEVKRASPSQGMIRESFDPVELAQAYQSAGADCLSVLTDEKYFLGSLADLRAVRAVVPLPILRKDFVIDSYQLIEARVAGADAALLIVAGLESLLLHDLYHEAKGLGLDVLVEVHDDAETEIALELGADLIGVNNRNLADFITDLTTSERLIPRITPTALAVSESALSEAAHIERVQKAGARAVLIGTAFSGDSDPAGKVRAVMAWPS